MIKEAFTLLMGVSQLCAHRPDLARHLFMQFYQNMGIHSFTHIHGCLHATTEEHELQQRPHGPQHLKYGLLGLQEQSWLTLCF